MICDLAPLHTSSQQVRSNSTRFVSGEREESAPLSLNSPSSLSCSSAVSPDREEVRPVIDVFARSVVCVCRGEQGSAGWGGRWLTQDFETR